MKSSSTARMRRAALFDLSPFFPPIPFCVFASQDAKWVEEETMSVSLRDTDAPRPWCQKQNCFDHTSSLFLASSLKDRLLLWLHTAISVSAFLSSVASCVLLVLTSGNPVLRQGPRNPTPLACESFESECLQCIVAIRKDEAFAKGRACSSWFASWAERSNLFTSSFIMV